MSRKPPHQASKAFTVDLSQLLSPAELSAFLRAAEEAGRTPQEHFLAITLDPSPAGPAADGPAERAA